jgi:hypothetical protein
VKENKMNVELTIMGFGALWFVIGLLAGHILCPIIL